MSSLLEMKSSVLRQVQRRQSTRGRRETAASASSPATPSPDSTPSRVTEGNGEFFERMKQILAKPENMRRTALNEGQGDCGTTRPAESVSDICGPEKMSRRELVLLYEEAVYSVLNRAGAPSPRHVTDEAELVRYLQKVFQIEPEEQNLILQRVQESKRASYSLKVSVIEGKNLLAKDANGFSDPYCMLGILLGHNQRDPEDRKERRFSFRKKKERTEKRSSTREVLAAKCIQVTEVKPATLNPVWNESFVFEIDDALCDLLHLDIWDHDDDVSVTEACKKLNEVSGLKGMGRYFKQIAKSMRSNGSAASAVEENVDDFLGCLNIPLNEVPVDGWDRWFKLEPRSSASSVQGDCHLTLKLFTSQRDTCLSKRDSGFLIHEKLLNQIIDYEHSQVQMEPHSWDGTLSQPAWTVLSHHAMQVDLSPLQQAIAHWRGYSRHHRSHCLSYCFLLELLRKIEEEWGPPSEQGALEESLAESFSLHAEYCMSLLRNLRQVFPCSSPTAVSRCQFMLRTLGHIHAMQAFKTVCPFHKELHLEIATMIKKTTVEWYEGFISPHKTDEGTLEVQLKRMVQGVDAVCADVQRAQSVYDELFSSSVKVEFFSISYRQLEKLVADDVSTVMERAQGALEQAGSRLPYAMGETVFELYISLKTLKLFREFLPHRDAETLALTGFHEGFKTSIHMWLQIVHEKSCDRIQRAVDVDQLEPTHDLSKHSTSALDVTTCFSQVQQLWTQLAWPDPGGAAIFLTRLTDDICRAALLYAELLKHKAERGLLRQDNKSYTRQLCVCLNNTEHVRGFLGGLPGHLERQTLEQTMEETCGAEDKEQVNKALNAQLYDINMDLQREARRIIGRLTDTMTSDLKKYIQHISLSPDSINNDDAVSPLMKYLDDTLVHFNESLEKDNLARILQSLWCLLLRMIFETVAENRGVSLEFYGRFHYTMQALLEFFHAEGEGLSLQRLRNEDYRALEGELRLNKCSSNELMEQHFLEKITHQRTLTHSRFGRISVKCYYEASDQRLNVEILHAADLIALDANGLSDPFVIVELCPRHLFPAAKSQRTQVKPKTLHPVFDEIFQFHVSADQYQHTSSCVAFTVMDYDWLSTNDFAGEAILPLSDFCGPEKPGSHGGGMMVQPLVLHLSRPKPGENPILKMLEARTSDREAQEFVRKLREIHKSVGEEE